MNNPIPQILPVEENKETEDIPQITATTTAVIKAGTLYNCWLFLKTHYYDNLPGTVAIQKNLQAEYSDIAVFYYPKSGLWHYAKTIANHGDRFVIDEANYAAGKRTQREVLFTDRSLVGFYSMQK